MGTNSNNGETDSCEDEKMEKEGDISDTSIVVVQNANEKMFVVTTPGSKESETNQSMETNTNEGDTDSREGKKKEDDISETSGEGLQDANEKMVVPTVTPESKELETNHRTNEDQTNSHDGKKKGNECDISDTSGERVKNKKEGNFSETNVGVQNANEKVFIVPTSETNESRETGTNQNNCEKEAEKGNNTFELFFLSYNLIFT